MVGTAGIVEIYSVSWCPLNVTCDFSDYLSRSFSSSVSRCQRKCQKESICTCTRMTLAWIYRGRYASILFLPQTTTSRLAILLLHCFQ